MPDVPSQEPGVYSQDRLDLPLFENRRPKEKQVDLVDIAAAGYSLCSYTLLNYLGACNNKIIDPWALYVQEDSAFVESVPQPQQLQISTEKPWLRVDIPTQDILGSIATGYLKHMLVAIHSACFERFARHVASSFYVDGATGDYCKLSWQQVLVKPALCKSKANQQERDFTPVPVSLLCLLRPDMIVGLNAYDPDGTPVVGHLRFNDRRANDIMAKTYVTGQDNPVEAVNKEIENTFETPYGMLQLEYQEYRSECQRRSESPVGFLDFVNQLAKERNAINSTKKTI